MEQEHPDHSINLTIARLRESLDRVLFANPHRPLVLGIAGAQGSGKSTIARLLASKLTADRIRSAAISLDDFYLGRSARLELAACVHPLFATRGPPGTHDIGAALSFFASVRSGSECIAPVFDKAQDEPSSSARWRRWTADIDVVIFEGWCLWARAQSHDALLPPINMLEREYDRDGRWRAAVNEALGSAYQMLFAQIDHLVYLQAPNFDCVRRWRLEQEEDLGATLAHESRARLMSADEILFFVQFFERITRSIMDNASECADLTLRLDENRRVTDAN